MHSDITRVGRWHADSARRQRRLSCRIARTVLITPNLWVGATVSDENAVGHEGAYEGVAVACFSLCILSLLLIMDEEKQEPARDAVTSSVKAGEVSLPYSIYTNKEKWMIVGIVALAGFYRYVLESLQPISPFHVVGILCARSGDLVVDRAWMTSSFIYQQIRLSSACPAGYIPRTGSATARIVKTCQGHTANITM
jgi:hypothetical protein